VRFAVRSSIWGCALFIFTFIIEEECKMSETESKSSHPMQTITIGNTEKDAALIEKIVQYKTEQNLSSEADAVRELCNIALGVGKWGAF
jgi:hypothetical protein